MSWETIFVIMFAVLMLICIGGIWWMALGPVRKGRDER